MILESEDLLGSENAILATTRRRQLVVVTMGCARNIICHTSAGKKRQLLPLSAAKRERQLAVNSELFAMITTTAHTHRLAHAGCFHVLKMKGVSMLEICCCCVSQGQSQNLYSNGAHSNCE